MTLEEFQNYYANLLILQYWDKPRARETILSLAKMIYSNGILLQVLNGYNITQTIGAQNYLLQQISRMQYEYDIPQDACDLMRSGVLSMYTFTLAIGKQLDALAAYVGAYRTYVYGGESVTLTDEQLVKLVQLKAIQNNGNHSMSSIVSACVGGFGDGLIPLSAGTMVMMYIVDTSIIDGSVLRAAYIEGGLPRAMGVRIAYYIEKPDSPWFCFTDYAEGGIPSTGRQNEWRMGFLTYATYSTEEQWMSFEQIGTFL